VVIARAAMCPAISFGGAGMLLNTTAWLLRRIPVFAVGGTGAYRIRPIHVDDLARLCLAAGSSASTYTVDAVGPDRPTFFELVCLMRDSISSRARVLRVPGEVVPQPVAARLGAADTLLTRDEYYAMADGWPTDGAATGEIAVTRWIAENSDTLGRRYANEIDRHFRPDQIHEHDR
jgi:NADH dehydrogenase